MKKKVFLIVLILLNMVLVPKIYAYDSGREVFVRHINKATGAIITQLSNNTQEKIGEDGSQSLVNSSTATDADIEYNEYYNYEIGATMNITKSLVVKADGKNYKYLGANVCTMYSLEEAYNIMEQKKSSYRAGISTLDIEYMNNSATSQFVTKNSDGNDVTIIDFYYTEQNTEDISPRLLSNTNAWSGNEGEVLSDITYVPAGGSVSPYFITPKFIVKDLKYEKVIEDGKIYYNVNKFSVYRLDNSYLKSSDTVNKNGKQISGHLVGRSNDTVFSGLGEIVNLPIRNTTKDEITYDLNQLLANSKTTEIPSNNNLDIISGEQASASDYLTDGFLVSYTKYNGLRSAKGNVTYATYDVLTGATSSGFEHESINEHFINVYTPIQLATPEVTVTSGATVNHSNTSSSTVILADDASFEIKVRSIDSNFSYYNNINEYIRANFVSIYYFIFDFDVLYQGRIYPKGEPISVWSTARTDGYTTINAQVAPNETLSRDNTEHKIIVIAEASNVNSADLTNYIIDQEVGIQINHTMDATERKYINDSGNNEVSFSNDVDSATSYNDPQYTEGYRFYADGYYFAMQSLTVRTVSRIYDFKITDCTDLSFRSVFRNTSSATDVNALLGNNYYSGIRRMFVYANNNKEYTEFLDRNDININGTSATKTLPIGPYKHTTASYISAPKLGYRIAFDLKTTGYYIPTDSEANGRKIQIKPTYYYISKDGANLIKDITLYYKDETGRYKRFVGSDYMIYFIPNDGYRYKSNSTTSNVSNMSKKQECLNIGSSSGEFYLTDKMMSSDDTNYIQSWYGEFKLPNTTIAVREGDSVDNALKDGYIGVKFDITCIDSNLNETVSYGKNDTTSSRINTTQWDYEGYLGFSTIGRPVTEESSLRLQLEKGIWNINAQDLYEYVKGTVVLYDIDSRAADDIQ